MPLRVDVIFRITELLKAKKEKENSVGVKLSSKYLSIPWKGFTV